MQNLEFTGTPLLSVFMVTYNHEKFIRQALESVICQQTTFPIEVVIGEDCSTDGTRAVIKEFEIKYPGIIFPIYHERNMGPTRNAYEFVYPKLRGKYIACLEGDDYWIDPLKLQKQVDFLEKNPVYSTCFHRAKLVYAEGVSETFRDINIDTPPTTSLHDIVKGNYIHTVTCVFRKNIHVFPQWFKDVLTTDWVLHILNAEYGKIYFMNEEMAAYRIHYGGVLSTKTAIGPYDIRKMEMYYHLANHFKEKDTGIFKWFHELHYHQKAVYYGIQNFGKRTMWQRMRILMASAVKIKKIKLLLAAFLVPFFPSDSLSKMWDFASQKKRQLTIQ